MADSFAPQNWLNRLKTKRANKYANRRKKNNSTWSNWIVGQAEQQNCLHWNVKLKKNPQVWLSGSNRVENWAVSRTTKTTTQFYTLQQMNTRWISSRVPTSVLAHKNKAKFLLLKNEIEKNNRSRSISSQLLNWINKKKIFFTLTNKKIRNNNNNVKVKRTHSSMYAKMKFAKLFLIWRARKQNEEQFSKRSKVQQWNSRS